MKRKKNKYTSYSKYNKFNKYNKKNKYIIIALIILIVLGLIVTVSCVKEERNLNFFEKAVKDTVTHTSKILYMPIAFVKEKIEISKEKKEMYKEYKKLKKKAEKSDYYKAQVKELQTEIDGLKESLVLNNVLSEYEPINANIVNRNVGYWYNTITIDKGSQNKIKKGMAVVVNKGLIGKVIKTSNFTSTVKLITADELNGNISVKIKLDDKDVYGLLTGYNKKSNTYKIEGISESDEIKIDSLVTTTGLSDIFPSGILVGKVSNVIQDNYDLTKIVEVTPSVDFNDISVVTVLKRGVDVK